MPARSLPRTLAFAGRLAEPLLQGPPLDSSVTLPLQTDAATRLILPPSRRVRVREAGGCCKPHLQTEWLLENNYGLEIILSAFSCQVKQEAGNSFRTSKFYFPPHKSFL